MYIIKRSKKPFKNRHIVVKAVSEGESPITGKEVFFLEDGTFVEKRMVREATNLERVQYKTLITHGSFYPDILRRYASILNCNNYRQNLSDPCSNEHLMWMLVELDRKEMHEMTKHRWLGYVQGVMISRNLTTLDIERDLTRGYFK